MKCAFVNSCKLNTFSVLCWLSPFTFSFSAQNSCNSSETNEDTQFWLNCSKEKCEHIWFLPDDSRQINSLQSPRLSVMAQARKKSIDGIFATHQASFAMKVFKLLESLAVAVLVKRETDYASVGGVSACECGGKFHFRARVPTTSNEHRAACIVSAVMFEAYSWKFTGTLKHGKCVAKSAA